MAKKDEKKEKKEIKRKDDVLILDNGRVLMYSDKLAERSDVRAGIMITYKDGTNEVIDSTKSLKVAVLNNADRAELEDFRKMKDSGQLSAPSGTEAGAAEAEQALAELTDQVQKLTEENEKLTATLTQALDQIEASESVVDEGVEGVEVDLNELTKPNLLKWAKMHGHDMVDATKVDSIRVACKQIQDGNGLYDGRFDVTK